MIKENIRKCKKVKLGKLKNGAYTYSMSCKNGDKFILELFIDRSLGITEALILSDDKEYNFNWSGLYCNEERYTLDLSEAIFKCKDRKVFRIVLKSGNNMYFLNPLDGVLNNSHVEYDAVKSTTESFIFTIEDDAPPITLGGCIYHIFVDRFNKTNPTIRSNSRYDSDWENGIPEYAKTHGDFLLNNTHFGGNFEGIEEKLEYLSLLSVDAIYLSPVSKAFSNHKYDVGSYFDIDENFGGEEKFKRLIKSCHEKGIKVILDCVFNHTGDNSLYFNKYGEYDSVGAYQSKQSSYFNWYTFSEYPNKYDSWWGITCLPSIKKGCREFMEFVCGNGGVIDYYMRLGIDGVRLDVADELTLEFIKRIKDAVHRNNKQGIIIGEVWENAVRKKAYGEDKFYFDAGKLDSVTNYPLMNAIIEFSRNGSCAPLKNVLSEIYCDYPERNSLMLLNILSTHDTKRFISRFVETPNQNAEKAKFKMTATEYKESSQKLKNAMVIQAFLPGIPCIYYGDEIGMQGLDDPFNRMPMKWNSIDQDLLSWYRKIIKIRKNNRPLCLGGFEVKYLNDGIFIFDRFYKDERIRIIVNQSPKNIRYNVNGYDLINGQKIQFTNIGHEKCACISLCQ